MATYNAMIREFTRNLLLTSFCTTSTCHFPPPLRDYAPTLQHIMEKWTDVWCAFTGGFPLIKIAGPQWDSLVQLHRVALRFCIGIPSFANTVTKITEPQDMPLEHQAESRALCPMIQRPSANGTFKKLFVREPSHLGKLAALSQDQIACQNNLCGASAPHDRTSQVQGHDSIPELPTKQTVPSVVCWSYVSDLLDTKFSVFVHVHTDGLVTRHHGTITAACHISKFEAQLTGRLTSYTTIVTAELWAIKLALKFFLRHSHPFNLVILRDLRAPLVYLNNSVKTTPSAREVLETCKDAADHGWILHIQ